MEDGKLVPDALTLPEWYHDHLQGLPRHANSSPGVVVKLPSSFSIKDEQSLPIGLSSAF